MPDIEENELIARIEWNENIHVDENRRRVDELFKELEEPETYNNVDDYAPYVYLFPPKPTSMTVDTYMSTDIIL